jgi:hypothetical protein
MHSPRLFAVTLGALALAGPASDPTPTQNAPLPAPGR